MKIAKLRITNWRKKSTAKEIFDVLRSCHNLDRESLQVFFFPNEIKFFTAHRFIFACWCLCVALDHISGPITAGLSIGGLIFTLLMVLPHKYPYFGFAPYNTHILPSTQSNDRAGPSVNSSHMGGNRVKKTYKKDKPLSSNEMVAPF